MQEFPDCWFFKHPITLSDDDQGVYNHLRNARYLGSMKSVSVNVLARIPRNILGIEDTY